MDTLPLENLAWVYKKVVTRRSYGIPVGKTVSAVICDRNGKEINIVAKEYQVDQLLTSIAERAPWVVAGFNEDLLQLWLRERSRFVEEVDQRRQQTQG